MTRRNLGKALERAEVSEQKLLSPDVDSADLPFASEKIFDGKLIIIARAFPLR
jgi:hypothetical protein